MNYWIISDTHFGHQKLIDTGYRPMDYNDLLFNNLEKYVSKNDVVIHLGDFAFKNASRIADVYCKIIWRKLATSWLVRGNHDKSATWYLNHGFDFCADKIESNIYGEKILFSHRPINFNDYKNITLNIHGHLHRNTYRSEEYKNLLTEKHFLYSAEIENYKPITLNQIISKQHKQ